MGSWYHGGLLGPPRFFTHARSSSLGPPASPPSRRSIAKTRSISGLGTMASPGDAPDLSRIMPKNASESSFHTLPDPRTASMSDHSRSGSASPCQAGANDEITALNNKLISAINYQTTLDETLAQTKHELEASRARIAKLEAEAKAHDEKLSSDLLKTKENLDTLKTQMAKELAEERKQRIQALQEKRGMEAELAELSSSLLEEANKMVSAANKERAAVEKKNQQLRDQIKDGETLLYSQSEQLLELKKLMQHPQLDGPGDEARSPSVSNTPSSPAMSREDVSIARLLEAMNLTPTTPETRDFSPAPSTSFTQLLKPMCRSDVPAYDDFRSLVHTAKSHAGSRMGSGSYNVSGFGQHTSASNGSGNALNTQHTRMPSTPTLPGSFSPTTETKGPVPLKDTKFYKRILVEDIEPALRLDLSQSISWLQRRSITTAFADSSLIVEPIPEASRKLYGKYTPCSLCAEYRKEDQNPRTHRMRVNEEENATKWPLCGICLEKVRGVGDLVGYVRMIRDGVVKCGDRDEELEAWNELIRLRERLFWARMAGGVVPSFIRANAEKSTPIDSNLEMPETSPISTTEERGARVQTPIASRTESGISEEGTAGSEKDAALQLQTSLDESLTTFDNLHNGHVQKIVATPPSTPPRSTGIKRESGGFPKISIPSNFWNSQVNVLR